MASKGRPYRTVELDDWTILVGKSAADNDELSIRVARPKDMWLHAAGGTAGSHVLIQNPEGQVVPRNVLERAAELAAWYSKSRGAPRAEVHYCLAANVSKKRGAPRGQVMIKRFKRIKVKPRGVEEGEG